MPKKVADVVEELLDMLKRSEKSVITIPWRDFYNICEIERFKAGRREEIYKEGWANGLVIGYGNNIVSVCFDTNFSMP